MWTVKAGKTSTAKLFLTHADMDVNVPDRSGSTALMEAARLGNVELLDLLLENKDIDNSARSGNGEMAFFLAVKARCLDAANKVITRNRAGPVVQHEEAYEEIHWAAMYGCKEVFDKLYHEIPTEPEIKEGCHDQALLIAIGLGRIEKLQSLLDGRDTHVASTNAYGETVLYCAVRWANLEAVNMIVDNFEIDLNVRNDQDIAALLLSLEYGFIDICKVFIDNGADIISMQRQGLCSPLDKIIEND